MKIIFSILFFSIVSLCLSQNAWAQKPLPSPVFYQTMNSDEWVSHSIHIQKNYSRVLVADASEHPPQQLESLRSTSIQEKQIKLPQPVSILFRLSSKHCRKLQMLPEEEI